MCVILFLFILFLSVTHVPGGWSATRALHCPAIFGVPRPPFQRPRDGAQVVALHVSWMWLYSLHCPPACSPFIHRPLPPFQCDRWALQGHVLPPYCTCEWVRVSMIFPPSLEFCCSFFFCRCVCLCVIATVPVLDTVLGQRAAFNNQCLVLLHGPDYQTVSFFDEFIAHRAHCLTSVHIHSPVVCKKGDVGMGKLFPAQIFVMEGCTVIVLLLFLYEILCE